MAKVIIVGAGISGLTIAYRVRQMMPSAEVVVLEQQDRPGGTIWTERCNGYQVEIGPNGFLDTKPSTINLCRDLGLQDRLVPASEGAARNRFLFIDGRLRRLPAGLVDLLRTDLLSWRGKFGLMAERFRSRRCTLGDESVDAFVRRRAGTEIANVFGNALVTGIYAGDPALLSVRASFPRLAAFEEKYGSVSKGFGRAALERRRGAAARGEPRPQVGRMWSFREGLRLLIETLRDRLAPSPQFGVGVRRIERAAGENPSAWAIVGEGQERWSTDAVVLACPAYKQAAILEALDRELADRVASIAYNRVAVVALGYRRIDVPGDVYGFGYIVPERTRRDILGVQWCSSIFPERAEPGTVLFRAMCGGWHRSDVVGWDDERLLRAVRDELRLAMKIHAAPLFHAIIRWDRAIPQYHLGHIDRVSWIEKRAAQYPGLLLAGNAYHGVAMNDCTEQAEIVARRVERFLGSLKQEP
jgi:oxygen-dependent protoporphyrinogen oxidase